MCLRGLRIEGSTWDEMQATLGVLRGPGRQPVKKQRLQPQETEFNQQLDWAREWILPPKRAQLFLHFDFNLARPWVENPTEPRKNCELIFVELRCYTCGNWLCCNRKTQLPTPSTRKVVGQLKPDCEMITSLWKMVWKFLTKSNMLLSYGPAFHS